MNFIIFILINLIVSSITAIITTYYLSDKLFEIFNEHFDKMTEIYYKSLEDIISILRKL